MVTEPAGLSFELSVCAKPPVKKATWLRSGLLPNLIKLTDCPIVLEPLLG